MPVPLASSQYAKPTNVRLPAMKWVQIKMDPNDTASLDSGWMDPAGVEATNEKDLARHAAEDEDDAMRDAARYARRVRRRLGLSQVEFSERIHVPEIKTVLSSKLNPRQSSRDFTGDEGLTPNWRLVVKENTIAGKCVVGLSIVDCNPVGINFRCAVR